MQVPNTKAQGPTNNFWQSVPEDIVEWVGRLHPVHRCNEAVLRSVLETGGLQSRAMRAQAKDDPRGIIKECISRDISVVACLIPFKVERHLATVMAWMCHVAYHELERLTLEAQSEKATSAVNQATQSRLDEASAAAKALHATMLDVCGWNKKSLSSLVAITNISDVLGGFVRLVAETSQQAFASKAAFGIQQVIPALTMMTATFQQGPGVFDEEEVGINRPATVPDVPRRVPAASVAVARFDVSSDATPDMADMSTDTRQFVEDNATALINEVSHCKNAMDAVKALERIACTHAANVFGAQLTGVGWEADRVLGTDQQIFATLGPNHGTFYGDIIIVLSRQLFAHPDFNVTPCAATAFYSGNVYKNLHQAWLPPTPPQSPEAIALLNRCKLNGGASRVS